MKGTQRDLNQEDGPNHFSFIISHLVICVSDVATNLLMSCSKGPLDSATWTNDQMKNVKLCQMINEK
jgi:hypothetical protein